MKSSPFNISRVSFETASQPERRIPALVHEAANYIESTRRGKREMKKIFETGRGERVFPSEAKDLAHEGNSGV
jgi:hypothetical protein